MTKQKPLTFHECRRLLADADDAWEVDANTGKRVQAHRAAVMRCNSWAELWNYAYDCGNVLKINQSVLERISYKYGANCPAKIGGA